MLFDRSTRSQITAHMTSEIDPTSSVVKVEVDGTLYAATWQGSPQAFDPTPEWPKGGWTQDALTDGYFAGPTHPTPAGAVVLTYGYHHTQTTLTKAGTTLSCDSSPIVVE